MTISGVPRLAGKTALIGGQRALSEAVARRFEAEGAKTLTCFDLAGWSNAAGQVDAIDILVVATSASAPDPIGGHAGTATRAALPGLRREGGAIVYVALPMGAEAELGMAGLGAANGGLRGLTRGAALEFGGDAIRVNMVQPGVVPELSAPVVVPTIPLRRDGDAGQRTGTIDDIVGAVLFLASDEAGYVHGTEHFVDGGLTQYRNASSSRAWDQG